MPYGLQRRALHETFERRSESRRCVIASDSFSFREFKPKGEHKQALPSAREAWWTLDGDKSDGAEVANAIGQHVKFLQKQQETRLNQLVRGARAYGNASMVGIAGMSIGAAMGQPSLSRDRISDNVIQSVIDTATARIGENKPRPYHLTSGGNWKLQRKAKKLNQFTDGLFYELDAYELGGLAQRDAEIFGDGLVFVTEKPGKDGKARVAFERVISAELWIDEQEGAYGKPRQLHWARAIDRQQLAASFPEKKDLIARAAPAPLAQNGMNATSADLVIVCESWHLPSSATAKDGAHCVSIEEGLLDPLTPWTHDYFPFARWQWSPRPLGYWGQSLAEQLQPKQIEVNKLLWVIQRSMEIAGTFKLLMESGSKIVKEHISNQIGAIIEYKGTPPTWFVPQVVPPEYYSHLQTLILSMYERSGISLQSATGVKPAGLNSGEAQRVYRDTVAERLKTQERLNEKGYMDLAKIAIAVARDIAERDKFYEVEAPHGGSLTTVRMTAEELNANDWHMQCFPTSSLPKDPAGRLSTIQEYIQAGFISPRQGRRLLDFPDLEANGSLANADEDLLTKVLDAICDDGEMEPPEPTDNLQLAMELVVEYIARARSQGLDEERIDMLRTWKAQLEALLQAAQPPAPAPGVMPQAAAAPAPVSPLVPNVPQPMAA